MGGRFRRGGRPKLLSLSALVEEHCEAVEWDLQHYCRLDLRDVWVGGLSWRRLGVMVRGFPPESKTKTALRNATPAGLLSAAAREAEYGPWSQTDMLLAELIDGIRWLQWAKTKDGADGKNLPKPYPRPGVERTPVAVVDDNVVSLLEYVRDHGGAAPEGYAEAT